MKKLILLCLIVSACSNTQENGCVEKVISIMPNTGNTCTYTLQNCGKASYYTFTDTCNRFNVGDTIK